MLTTPLQREQLKFQARAAKEKADLALAERNSFEKQAKEAVQESKRLAVSKQSIEKQFVFDLKKAERKTQAVAANPKSKSKMLFCFFSLSYRLAQLLPQA